MNISFHKHLALGRTRHSSGRPSASWHLSLWQDKIESVEGVSASCTCAILHPTPVFYCSSDLVHSRLQLVGPLAVHEALQRSSLVQLRELRSLLFHPLFTLCNSSTPTIPSSWILLYLCVNARNRSSPHISLRRTHHPASRSRTPLSSLPRVWMRLREIISANVYGRDRNKSTRR